MVYIPTLPTEVTLRNLDSNSQCVFCGKQDIIRKMYIASLNSGVEDYPATGIRIFPVNQSSYVFLCEWCAHFDSKVLRDLYTYWLLNKMIYDDLVNDIDPSNYNGIL